MLSLLIAAGEPSKVPFYLAGGVLVVWAVLLAATGLSRAAFPFNIRGERGAITISLILAAATIAMAVVTSAFIR